MYKKSKSYLPPRIRFVEFKVENGYEGSAHMEELTLFGLADGEAAGDSYVESSNSGDDFLGHGSTTFGSGGTDYGNFEWEW